MTAIASYYASVGVGIDPKSLQNVQRYLDTIQAKMVKFQKDAFKTSNLSFRLNNFTVNQASLRRTINTAVANQRIRLDNVAVGKIRISSAALTRQINAAIGASSTASGTGTPIRLRNFHVSQKELMAAINKAVNVEGRSSRIRIGALLSQSSLTGMRNQIRQAINQLVVNPTINPRVRATRTGAVQGQGSAGGSGGGGSRPSRFTTRDPRSMNPWHNPMMIGGATGAFMRYGMFSLPFVAGAYGLNALSKNMETLQNAEMAIMAQVGDKDLAQKELDFLYKLGRVHGVKMTDMAPGYSQMYAAAQGTVLGDKMQDSFQSFLQYASVIGMNEDQKKGAILALSQIVGKHGKNFAQELNLQLVNQGMPNARRLFADAVAGGDLEKFEGMMQRGEVGMEGVVKFLALLGDRARPFMADFYKTITRNKGVLSSVSEEWLKNFQKVGGATEGMVVIYRAFSQSLEDSLPFAQRLGDLFRRAGHIIAAGIVIPQEFIDWMKGEAKEGNFMTALFGEKSESVIQGIINQIEQLKRNMGGLAKGGEFSKWKTTLEEVEMILKAIESSLKTINQTIEATRVLRNDGVSAFFKHTTENQDVIDARGIARSQLQVENPNYTEADLANRTSQIFAAVQRRREDSWVPRMFQKSLASDPDGWLRGFTPESSLNYSPNRAVNIPQTPTSGPVKPYVRPLVVLPSPPSPVDIVNRAIEKMQPVPENEPFSTPHINQITPEVRIIISGGITVDGELGTMIDDTNLSEKFNEQIEQMLYGTRPQFSVVHR